MGCYSTRLVDLLSMQCRLPHHVQIVNMLVIRVHLPLWHSGVCSGSFDYATPVDQQFQFDYDLSMQQDQRSRSPAASPVRHVTKRPRHAAGMFIWGVLCCAYRPQHHLLLGCHALTSCMAMLRLNMLSACILQYPAMLCSIPTLLVPVHCLDAPRGFTAFLTPV